MELTRQEALDILQVKPSDSKETIRSAYKRLALEWHPDKHIDDKDEATDKFQRISAAYKRLTHQEGAGISGDGDGGSFRMTLDEMFELFSEIFCSGSAAAASATGSGGGSNGSGSGVFSAKDGGLDGYNYYGDDDYDDYDDEDDDDDDYDFRGDKGVWGGEGVPATFLAYLEQRKKKREELWQKPTVSQKQIEEAERLAKELMEEEEKEKQKVERKKAKNRKKKEATKKKKQEKKEKSTENRGGKDKKTNERNQSQSQQHHDDGKTNKNDIEEREEEEDEEEESDRGELLEEETLFTNSAFFGRIASKSGVRHESSSSSAEKSTTPMTASKGSNSTSAPAPPAPSSSTSVKSGNSKPSANKTNPPRSGRTPSATAAAEAAEGATENGPSDLDLVVLKSRQIAVKGNKLAELGHYNAAVDLFTEAIRLHRDDYRYHANRSFCYDRLRQYDRALRDANTAIRLASKWAKGYFRKGRALAGLKQYNDAELAFEEVLKLDKRCIDATQELERIRVQQLMDMGFSRVRSESAIRKYIKIRPALDSLLAGKLEGEYVSDDDNDDDDVEVEAESEKETYKREKESPRPENDQGSAGVAPRKGRRPGDQSVSVWVGNVFAAKVTVRDMIKIFSRCGYVLGVRILDRKGCAFVSYENYQNAASAVRTLTGYNLAGRNLVVRFPDNP